MSITGSSVFTYTSKQGVDARKAVGVFNDPQPSPHNHPAKLTFTWGRDLPTLYLVAEDDMDAALARR
jgi:hypothetical protein